ncbi:MAG: hypothetical protein RDV48_24380 [Candidatus Eremiobacteraeota bacterium]|nr:hypothetical protein [Candidatus Eremiobacteraeota bacterium]
MKSDNQSGDPRALMELLKSVTFPHPARGNTEIGSLFRAHSGFACLVPEAAPALIEKLREAKKDLDILGILVVVITKEPADEKEILVVAAPHLVEDLAPGEKTLLFIKENLAGALYATSVDDFLDIAVDYCEFDDQSRKHLSGNILRALQKKGKMPGTGESTAAVKKCGECRD